MINAFFFDEYNSSLQNGIGTYRDILLPNLAAIDDINVTLVSLNHCDASPNEKTLPYGGRQICLPYINGGRWRENGHLITNILKEFIADDPHNVFMLNHSPAADFIKELKKAFPLSKIMFTVHDLGWGAALLGDNKLLHEIWVGGQRPAIVSEETFNNVRKYCRTEEDIYDLVDRVMSISPFMHSVMLKTYGVDKTKAVTVYNGIESSEKRRLSRKTARRKLGFNDDEELIIFAGRPVRHKGIVPLLIAMRKLMQQRPKLRCIMCGSLSGFGDFMKYITPVASRLIFTGLLPRNDLKTWRAAADVGIMPSYSEPFGYSALEMINDGLPVIVSDRAAFPDIYHDGKNAFVAPVGDDLLNANIFADNIADAINRALDCKPSLLRRMREFNREMINSKFTASKMAEGYANVLRGIVAQ